MLTKNNFSLFDFCKKRADKVLLYGEESFDEEGNIMSFVDQAALVTHYLQLKNSNIDMPYASKAEGILNLWYEFVKEEKQARPKEYTGVADSDTAYQAYLFPDLLEAPFQAQANPKFTFIKESRILAPIHQASWLVPQCT